MTKRRKITVVGTGFVGVSIAVLLAKHNSVIAYDIDPERVHAINKKKSSVADEDINDFFKENNLDLIATVDKEKAYKDADFIIIATSADYDPDTKCFDTSSVDQTIKDAISRNTRALIIIKSTIPIGYSRKLREELNYQKIVFSPEFLREGKGLRDNLYPSRIVIGSKTPAAKEFVDLMIQGAEKENIETFFLDSEEAEAVKLFANNYLAMRISFFNELDSFAQSYGFDTKGLIDAVCSDNRIESQYNNPSFGYGGYCLPKGTKQLLSNFEDVPQKIISAIVESNSIRKDFIVEEILKTNTNKIGIYRLIMKSGSDNFRSSAIIGIMSRLQERGKEIIIYEPLAKDSTFDGYMVIDNLQDFKKESELILANRASDELSDVANKVFTRDIYGNN